MKACSALVRGRSVCPALARSRGRHAGGRRRWSSRAHIAEQAIPRLLIEIGGRAQAVLFLLVCDSATGLWPEHAVNLSTIKIIGLELLLKRR
jgi:hypothetical protein